MSIDTIELDSHSYSLHNGIVKPKNTVILPTDLKTNGWIKLLPCINEVNGSHIEVTHVVRTPSAHTLSMTSIMASCILITSAAILNINDFRRHTCQAVLLL